MYTNKRTFIPIDLILYLLFYGVWLYLYSICQLIQRKYSNIANIPLKNIEYSLVGILETYKI